MLRPIQSVKVAKLITLLRMRAIGNQRIIPYVTLKVGEKTLDKPWESVLPEIISATCSVTFENLPYVLHNLLRKIHNIKDIFTLLWLKLQLLSVVFLLTAIRQSSYAFYYQYSPDPVRIWRIIPTFSPSTANYNEYSFTSCYILVAIVSRNAVHLLLCSCSYMIATSPVLWPIRSFDSVNNCLC